MGGARRQLPRSFLNRFTTVHMAMLSEADEKRFFEQYCNVLFSDCSDSVQDVLRNSNTMERMVRFGCFLDN